MSSKFHVELARIMETESAKGATSAKMFFIVEVEEVSRFIRVN
jgi:hypothetical protein